MKHYPLQSVGSLVDRGAAEIQTGPFGTELAASEYSSSGTPVINVRNVGFGTLKTAQLEFVDEAVTHRLSQHILEPGDIVFARKGAVERHVLVRDGQAGWMQGSDCIRLRLDPQTLDSRYFSYHCLSSAHKQWMQTQGAHGTTMATLNQRIIRAIELPVPPLSAQQGTANILSAYDDLIENNNRRMALLEEAIHLLYREWFVYLRFPGHERVKVVDGVPEAWTARPLGELCVSDSGIQTGPFGSQLHQSDYRNDGTPVVMPKNIVDFKVRIDGISRVPADIVQRLDRHVLRAGDIVYGRRGEIGRRAYAGAREAGWLCGTGCIRLRPDPAVVFPRFLFQALGTRDTVHAIASLAIGVTMPNLSATVMRKVPILVPPRRVQRQYLGHAEPMQMLQDSLGQQNESLREARDLLLPRLMNGSIAV